MRKLTLPNFAVITAHALVVWVLCGGLMFAGMSLFSLGYALVIHAIGAPIIAGLVAWFYFKQFHYTTYHPARHSHPFCRYRHLYGRFCGGPVH